MRHLGYALAAALSVLIPAAAATSTPRDLLPQQSVHLRATAGDGSSDGVSDLVVTRENHGFRLRGYVESVAGCVELKAVTTHLGDYWGGDPVTGTCEANTLASVDAWTHHSDVVLTAVAPHGNDSDSAVVTLTGRP
ncbi:hypothetical protein [Streptacidiphilus rugosus]|uniref:hypothetical protein n=1 Tax=Streptacidiphilus rugosus TaxID=405783 RepID=UPI0005675DF7|nr:hypothetical protein [Streptacidiphilus rugosus]